MIRTDITLNGEVYRLARDKVVADVLGATARSWQMRRIPVTTKRIPRANVRRGEIDGEWIITYDDWSKGIGPELNSGNSLHYTQNVDATIPHALRMIGKSTRIGEATTPWGYNPAILIEFNSLIFLLVGRYSLIWNGTTLTEDEDFGAGVWAYDAIVHNNELVVAFRATYQVATRSAATGDWTPSTEGVYADRFAKVEDRLWRANNTNEVSSIGPTDNPLILANWSSPIAVGDDDEPITDLNGYGERLAVSKIDGLYLGDAAAIFPNVLPQIAELLDSENGKNTLVSGSDIFYPYCNGLIRYRPYAAEEVGPEQVFNSVSNSQSATLTPPGVRITALTAIGQHLWALTEPSYIPLVDSTGVLKTTDNEGSFTSYLDEATDNAPATTVNLSSLDTAANGDYFYVGYSAPFYGFYAHVGSPNINVATIAYQYWDGDSWESPLTDNPFACGKTGVTNVPFGASSYYSFWYAPSTWATKTINGITAYWLRINVSAALSSGTSLAELRIIKNQPLVYLLRGRARQEDDITTKSIVWDTIAAVPTLATRYATAMLASTLFPRYGGTHLIGASRQQLVSFWLGYDILHPPFATEATMSCKVYQSRDDAGMPELNKQWLDITTKGRVIDANHTIDGYYSVDGITFNSFVSNQASSPTTTALSNVTGRALQIAIFQDAQSTDTPTEVNEIEVRFRELPTYKNEYVATLEVRDGTKTDSGAILPDAEIQLTNLQTAHSAGIVTMIDLVETTRSVIVQEVQVAELSQEALEFPALLVRVRMTEI